MNIEAPAKDVEVMDFDPFSPAFRLNPEKFHALLFETSPGFIMMEGVPSAFVATFEHCTEVMRNFKAFSSLKPKDLPGMQRIDFFNGLPVMNYSDPPDHMRRRKVVSPAFMPKRTELMNEGAAVLVNALIDKIGQMDSFDVVDGFTKAFAIEMLLSQFLGIAPQHQHLFLDMVKTFSLLDVLKAGDPKPKPYLDAWEAGRTFCREQQILAREGKCDNLIGIIAGSADGGTIDEDEMMAMMMVLLTGGVSTVAGAAAAAMWNMARFPETAERVRKNPDLALPCLEESMRLDPPVSLVMRFATEDYDLGGKVIQKDMPVYSMIATANHDPKKFPDPYKFDLDRPNLKDHIAFGYGIHTCIGNTITRNIVPVLIRAVAERMPGLHLVNGGGVEWDTATPRARHLKHVHLSA